MSKQRKYSTVSYADAYFWSTRKGLAMEVSEAIGERYVKEDTQLGNILNQLKDLGYTELFKQLRSSI